MSERRPYGGRRRKRSVELTPKPERSRSIELTDPTRCWRCGELPTIRIKPTKGREFGTHTCSCRNYYVSKVKWWHQCAIRNRKLSDHPTHSQKNQ